MTYALLADLVVIVHLTFIIFATLGGLLALQWRWFPWLHLPAAGWGAFVEISGRICPLTPIENRLRRAAGGPTYEGDFVERYLLPVIYPIGLTEEVQLLLGGLVLVVNVGIYAFVWRTWRHDEVG